MKIEFNKEEMAILTAMVCSLREEVKNGIFEGDDEIAQRAKEAYSSLQTKVLVASLDTIMDEIFKDAMDAVILDEEE